MKSPAFQFYVDNFIEGTVEMTDSEVGLYMRLLCAQWSRGALPDNDDELFRFSRGSTTLQLERVKRKFAKCEDGMLRNMRIEQERAKQAIWREKSRVGGQHSAEKRKGGSRVVQPPCQPNGNTPSPSPSPSPLDAKQTNRWPSLAEAVTKGEFIGMPKAECERFWHHYESMGWIDKNGNPIQKWESKLMVWKVEQAAKNPTSTSTGSKTTDKIIQGKEYERIIERMKVLRATYSDHQTWGDKDRAEFNNLKKRRDELKSTLNITI